jgi:DNA-damage-inducible protein D
MENSNLIPLEGKEIRKIWHQEQWYFSVVDVIEILTDSNNSNRYWSDLKRKFQKESQSYDFFVRLNMPRVGGKSYPSDCANTEGILRIVMSVPSPKAEPLRLWLAEQGKRAIEEAENPELMTERQAELYKAKGYTDEWIERRRKTIEIRKELTDEWQKRGVKKGQEYSILTATIAKGTFGLNPSEHGKLKGLENQNLRDHMTPLELIFTALGEELTRDETVKVNAQGFEESHDAATQGGYLAGEARRAIERKSGKKIVSTENYLKPPKGTDTLPESKEPKE